MKYIKFLLLSFIAVITMACEPNLNQVYEVQKFPEAAYYSGDLMQQVGEEQTTLFTHVELYKQDDGSYWLTLGPDGTDIQIEPQFIILKELVGDMVDGTLTLAAEDVVGTINLGEHTFASLNAELTADRAIIALDFGDGKVWSCEVDAVKHMLE